MSFMHKFRWALAKPQKELGFVQNKSRNGIKIKQPKNAPTNNNKEIRKKNAYY